MGEECNECCRLKERAEKKITVPSHKYCFDDSFEHYHKLLWTLEDFSSWEEGLGGVKAYPSLFTCSATRVVHLEKAFGLDTGSFLNALYSMVNRKGPILEMVSDNGRL